MNTQPFWKPQPVPPDQDWIAPWLKRSLVVSTLGWIAYGVFALAFDDVAVISSTLQSWLVLAGSMLIVAGAEMNTAPTVVAVARKWGAGKGQVLDVVAFVVSLIGSITAGLIAFSIRQVRLGNSPWRILALDVGPLVVGVAIACDFYAASIELGLLKADYEQEMAQWLEDERKWNKETGYVEPMRKVEIDPGWPMAHIGDVRRVLSKMNGERSALDEDSLEQELAGERLRLRSSSSTKRWLRMAHQWTHKGNGHSKEPVKAGREVER